MIGMGKDDKDEDGREDRGGRLTSSDVISPLDLRLKRLSLRTDWLIVFANFTALHFSALPPSFFCITNNNMHFNLRGVVTLYNAVNSSSHRLMPMYESGTCC